MAEEPTPEQIAEQIRQLRIQDVLLPTMSTLGQLAYVKLDAKDLEQARLAIDAIAALVPTLEGSVDPQVVRDFNQLLANVRLAFATVVSAPDRQAEAPAAEGADGGDEPPAGTPVGGEEV